MQDSLDKHRTAHEGEYIGATGDELSRLTQADKFAGFISQRAMFTRRGHIALHPDRLVLSDWGDAGDLVLTPADITGVEVRFDHSYGRSLGGLFHGKPLIVHIVGPADLYLLVDRHELTERTGDADWGRLLSAWLDQASDTAPRPN